MMLRLISYNCSFRSCSLSSFTYFSSSIFEIIFDLNTWYSFTRLFFTSTRVNMSVCCFFFNFFENVEYALINNNISQAPGFAYAWLEIVSHRVFIGRILSITPQQKGWPMYAQVKSTVFTVHTSAKIIIIKKIDYRDRLYT